MTSAVQGDRPRYPVQLCASLVENPVNLGGLCRSAEAFRLEALILADLKVCHLPAFYKPAVATQRWQPLRACPVTALPAWLAAQQAQGYHCVALAATPGAIALPVFAFPAQTVLLVGRELTGIPTPLLAQCDAVVAIPQYGQVESLNVQTAAAIALYEYIRQYPDPTLLPPGISALNSSS